jgi:hypothetical protein
MLILQDYLGNKSSGNSFTLFDRSSQPLPSGRDRYVFLNLNQLKDLYQVLLPFRKRFRETMNHPAASSGVSATLVDA